MPNMFGGDQCHPAYDPRTRIADNQVMVHNDLFTVNKETGEVIVERVDGSGGVVHDYPIKVAELCKRFS